MRNAPGAECTPREVVIYQDSLASIRQVAENPAQRSAFNAQVEKFKYQKWMFDPVEGFQHNQQTPRW